jgi:glycosyltransferase involved in cell wall biosynthesis
MLYNLLKHIKKKRFRCIACCYKKSGKVIRLLKSSGVKVELLDTRKNLISQMTKIKEKYNIKIVYLNTYKLFREAVILKGLSCRVVYHMHHLLKYTHPRFSAAQKDTFLKSIYCASDRVIACSKAVKAQFNLLKKANTVNLVYNGIDTNDFSRYKDLPGALRREYNIAPGTKIVATVGRMDPGKGHRLFIKACKRIKNSYENTKFFLIGSAMDARFYDIIQSDIKHMLLTNDVIFTGFRHDIPKIMPDVDVLVLASLNEAFNVSLLEGMAAGRAVVAYDGSGVSELIRNKKNGILAYGNNTRSLAESILYLLRNDSKRSMIGRAAEKTVKTKYDAHLYAKKIQSVLRCLIS